MAVEDAIGTAGKNIVKALNDPDSSVSQKIGWGANLIDETLYGKNQKVYGPDGLTEEENPGEHGKFDRLRFCHWAAPEYGVAGDTLWTYAFQAAQLGIALLNATIQGQISDMQEDLAEGYYQQAKYKWDRFANNYMPLEYQLLWEASHESIKEMNCEADRTRAHEAVDPSFDYMNTYMGNQAKAYRLCMDDTAVRQLEYSRNLMLVDTENYNLRDDQWFVDFKNDQRWNRRSNILNLGRNLGSVAMQYGDVARKLMGDVSDIANKAFGSLSQALGYYGSRFDTYYPTSYLSGNSSPTYGLVTTSYTGTSWGPGSGANATLGG